MQKHHCTLQKEAFFNYSSNHTMPPETHKHMFVQAPASVCVCVCVLTMLCPQTQTFLKEEQ